MSDTCHYCGEAFDPPDLRPYGPGGAMACFPCITATPERNEAAQRVYGALLEANEAISPTGAVTLDSRTSDGPRPSTQREVASTRVQPLPDVEEPTDG